MKHKKTKFILITLPEFIDNEGALINAAFESGIDLLHIRKPGAKKSDIEALINSVDQKYYDRIMLHDCFIMAEKYFLKGMHLNSRNSVLPDGYFDFCKSRSSHSIEELKHYLEDDSYEYIFMSPVFDSISKEGYTSAFTPAEIKSCIDDGTINDRVIALGGICKDNIPQVKEWNFGGVAILGDVWQYKDDINQFKSHIEELADLIKT